MRIRRQLLLCFLILGLVAVFFICSSVSAQYWQAMPPYNLLWPLWVTDLNYFNFFTGQKTPIVTSVNSATRLINPTTQSPVMPAWVWNPSINRPWFLFNAPPSLGSALYFYDELFGFNAFPSLPGYSIPLPPGYETLVPNAPNFNFSATLANLNYLMAFLSAPDVLAYTSLLTPSQLWGVPPFPAAAPAALPSTFSTLATVSPLAALGTLSTPVASPIITPAATVANTAITPLLGAIL